jgi:hypothetical protein
MTVKIGVDPHNGSHTAVAVDEGERSRAELPVQSGPEQLSRLLSWAERFPEQIWAAENASGLGYLLAHQLVATDESVRRRPAQTRRAGAVARRRVDQQARPPVARLGRVALAGPQGVAVEDHSAVTKSSAYDPSWRAAAERKCSCVTVRYLRSGGRRIVVRQPALQLD